jgi:hypothetical protein
MRWGLSEVVKGGSRALLMMLLPLVPALGQTRFQGEDVLRLFDPAWSPWGVSFERERDGYRSVPQTEVRRLPEGSLAVRLPHDSAAATGVAIRAGHYDLSGYEEIHLWVEADAEIAVQPYSQTSGYIFRDGGDTDVVLDRSGRLELLVIHRESMADPSMVESIGIQVRPGFAAGANLRLLAVTALPIRIRARAPVLTLSDVVVPSSGQLYAIYTADFNLSRTYDNPYDPGQIDVEGRFTTPSGKEIAVTAFWSQDYQVVQGSETFEQYVPSGSPRWRIRYLPTEAGQHSLRITASDKDGSADSGPYTFSVAAGSAPGPVRRHPVNPLYMQYANGAPYIPLGHNLGFEDGNPNLNGTAYYRSLLPAFSASGENWTRFWMTDFSRTALEWAAAHWSGFYQGVGIYSQRAAWRVDQFFEIALANGVQIQLVINDHGQFSTYSNQRWDQDRSDVSGSPGNPYNSVNGGPVPQANPEQFFSNAEARALFRRRLRYLIARWSAFPNLLAWELFNEVQWSGTQTKNMRYDLATRTAIVDWHHEMADVLRAQDPFGHLVTTSSDDYYGSPGFDSIWKLDSIDTVQSHHYNQPPAGRDARIREYVAAAQQAYRKPVIIAEMGVKADSQPECDFDPQTFLSNTSVPGLERTTANRDHIVAGTTLRNGLWSAALTQSGAMNWWWGCYMADDLRRNRKAPDFPLHSRLFPPLASFWGGEDPASSSLQNASLEASGQILAYGLQDSSQAFFWVRDSRNAYGSGFGPAIAESRTTDGASVKLSGLDPGPYVLSLYDCYGNGDLVSQSDVSVSGEALNIPLLPFLGDAAFKIGKGATSTWGAVPRSVKAWITDGDERGGPVFYSTLRSVPGFSDAAGGAVLTYFENDLATWELTVPAVRASKHYWTVAEIGAPSQTGLALVNSGIGSASIQLLIYDENGRWIATTPLTLARGEHVAKFLVEWFGQALAPLRGTLEVRSNQSLGALALRGTTNDEGQFIMTSIPAAGDDAQVPDRAGAFPQVADGGGYQTEWLMLNPFETPLSGKVSFRRSDGSVWPLTIQGAAAAEIGYSIPAHGLVRWTSSGSAPDTSAGYCLLVPDTAQEAPAGGAVIRYLPGGRLRSETGLPFLTLSANAGSYWEVGPDFDTGIALVNASDREQPINLLLYLRDGGEQVLQAQVTVAAWGHTAKFVTQLFSNLPAASRGYLRISADSPFGFLPLRMRTTPRGVLFSSLLLGTPAGGADWIFPQVVHGSGYRSQFIIVNPGDSFSSGRMSFFDPAGNAARLLLRKP